MHIHILGICGTFMGGLAVLARAAGHRVTGCDAGVYPPMSTQLEAQGIALDRRLGPVAARRSKPDLFVIGNVVSRGNPLMEAILDAGPALRVRSAMARRSRARGQAGCWRVAGTHGKTTTSSMLAWILERAGLFPGLPDRRRAAGGFGISARLTDSPWFVIEADEYDTAFFDKRSKFVHYRPRVAVLNNLEYDHADIFPDLAAIETQFHHLVRTVPSHGTDRRQRPTVRRSRTCSRAGPGRAIERFEGEGGSGVDWATCVSDDPTGAHFEVLHEGGVVGHEWRGRCRANTTARTRWRRCSPRIDVGRLDRRRPARRSSAFGGVKRRMEVRGTIDGVTVYDDFAHHPTAIATTHRGPAPTPGRGTPGASRIVAVVEPRSNTMKLGTMKAALPDQPRAAADRVFGYGAKGPAATRSAGTSAKRSRRSTKATTGLDRERDGSGRPIVFDNLDKLVAAIVDGRAAGRPRRRDEQRRVRRGPRQALLAALTTCAPVAQGRVLSGSVDDPLPARVPFVAAFDRRRRQIATRLAERGLDGPTGVCPQLPVSPRDAAAHDRCDLVDAPRDRATEPLCR